MIHESVTLALSHSETAVHRRATHYRFGREMPEVLRLHTHPMFWEALGGVKSHGRDWGSDIVRARRWKQLQMPLMVTTIGSGAIFGISAACTALAATIIYFSRKYYKPVFCEVCEVIHPPPSWTVAKVFGGIAAGSGLPAAVSGAALYRSLTFEYEIQNAKHSSLETLKEADADRLERQGLLGREACKRLRVAQAVERMLARDEKCEQWNRLVAKLKERHLPGDPDGYHAAYDKAWMRKDAHFSARRAELARWYAEGAYHDYVREKANTKPVKSFDRFRSTLL